MTTVDAPGPPFFGYHDGDLAGPVEIGCALLAEWRAADCLLDETRRDPRGEPGRGDLGGRRA